MAQGKIVGHEQNLSDSGTVKHNNDVAVGSVNDEKVRRVTNIHIHIDRAINSTRIFTFYPGVYRAFVHACTSVSADQKSYCPAMRSLVGIQIEQRIIS